MNEIRIIDDTGVIGIINDETGTEEWFKTRPKKKRKKKKGGVDTDGDGNSDDGDREHGTERNTSNDDK